MWPAGEKLSCKKTLRLSPCFYINFSDTQFPEMTMANSVCLNNIFKGKFHHHSIKVKGSLSLLSHSVMSDFITPNDYSLPGSSVHGLFQARILERVSHNNLSHPLSKHVLLWHLIFNTQHSPISRLQPWPTLQCLLTHLLTATMEPIRALRQWPLSALNSIKWWAVTS